MSDLIERLRKAAMEGTDPSPFDTICHEAADELERLRKSRTAEHIDMLMADVERLQEIDRQRVETNNSLTIENARLQERAERAEAELSNALCEVVSDDSEWCLTWDGKTAGQWAGQCKQVEAERDALLADAERWRFFRDADRSAGLDMELVALYSMESLDDFIDAAMRDKEQSNG